MQFVKMEDYEISAIQQNDGKAECRKSKIHSQFCQICQITIFL